MSVTIHCDGCAKSLLNEATKEGPRDLPYSQGQRVITGLYGPDMAHLRSNRVKVEFHLCEDCTTTAFDAIGIASETVTILGG